MSTSHICDCFVYKATVHNRRKFLQFWAIVALSALVCAIPALAKTKTEPRPSVTAEKKEKGLPLKPDRTVEFTTDEGTWLSLDVSPDGQTIVFELVGDIYTLPIEGGHAKLIDGGMSFDSQPKFSPDGQWIAFLSDREGSEN